MESWIKIKAGRQEMEDFYFNDPEISVKWYERAKNGLYKCLIRHMELPSELEGTFTINELRSILHE